MITNVLNAGSLFTTLDPLKSSVLPPGSIGFVAHIRQVHRPLCYTAETVIIRKGKTGKQRLDSKNIRAPIFLTPELQENEKYIEFLSKELVTLKYYMHIKPVDMLPSILEFTELEFIAWAFAYYRHIISLMELSNPPFKFQGEQFTPLSRVSSLPSKWQNNPQEILDYYKSTTHKREVVSHLRKTYLYLLGCSKLYHQRLNDHVYRSLELLKGFVEAKKMSSKLLKEIVASTES
jgi:hypothetical protein